MCLIINQLCTLYCNFNSNSQAVWGLKEKKKNCQFLGLLYLVSRTASFQRPAVFLVLFCHPVAEEENREKISKRALLGEVDLPLILHQNIMICILGDS